MKRFNQVIFFQIQFAYKNTCNLIFNFRSEAPRVLEQFLFHLSGSRRMFYETRFIFKIIDDFARIFIHT
jgi:hypothetical protein